MKSMIHWILSWSSLILIIAVSSCDGSPEIKQRVLKRFTVSKPPQQVIVIRPIGRVDMKKVAVIKSRLDKIFDSVEVRRPEQIPVRFYYKPRSRYRADSIVRWLATGVKNGEVHLAVTGYPISITHKELKIRDYGVFGWGNIKGPQTCVVSDYLLKRKDLFYIIAEHELGHNFGLDHCPTSGCYMMAGKGKDRTATMTGFCGRCKDTLVKQGWRL
jgi:archaemetzincin